MPYKLKEMKFRDTPVDGFFCIHTYEDGPLLTHMIEEHLDLYGADMEDVQYSTHVQEGKIMNDVLVMYRKKEKTIEDIDPTKRQIGKEPDKLEGWV